MFLVKSPFVTSVILSSVPNLPEGKVFKTLIYIDNTKLGGGINRWHLLTTRNSWTQQTGLQPGVLQSQYNNYETFSNDAVTGQVENFGCNDPDGQYPDMGQYEYLIAESQGFATMNVTANDKAYVFMDMKLPDVGADDILDEGFRAYMKNMRIKKNCRIF